ncbi:MAG TPA: response regulator transcription factor, partial [Saprospiraceae bacterium]|nr:response regulator transcription factor [Saprospiraceae bacterium]
MRILLVEDEESIRNLLRLNLELEGYEVVSTANGRKALDLIGGQHFDLLLLDVMLPDVDGFSITEQVRLSNPTVPILLLTAKDTSQDRVAGLKKGADDYLTKPFNLEELLLRVSKLLRRSQRVKGESTEVVEFGENRVNFDTFEASTWEGKQ